MQATVNLKTSEKRYDLEDRTLQFAKRVRSFVNALPKSITIREDAKQLTRASGSIGANYIEANNCLGKKDFIMRLRICRKEAKETTYWLNLIEVDSDFELMEEHDVLTQESVELTRIFGSILQKSVF